MTPEELNAMLEGMTISDLLDKLSPNTLAAVRSDLIAAQPLTEEEQAYFAAEADLSAAMQKADQAARTALRSQDGAELTRAGLRFREAARAADKLAEAKLEMDAAFRLTAEYAAQVAESDSEAQ